jgi:hypothetical protein
LVQIDGALLEAIGIPGYASSLLARDSYSLKNLPRLLAEHLAAGSEDHSKILGLAASATIEVTSFCYSLPGQERIDASPGSRDPHCLTVPISLIC